jgi:hypothetical protein
MIITAVYPSAGRNAKRYYFSYHCIIINYNLGCSVGLANQNFVVIGISLLYILLHIFK